MSAAPSAAAGDPAGSSSTRSLEPQRAHERGCLGAGRELGGDIRHQPVAERGHAAAEHDRVDVGGEHEHAHRGGDAAREAGAQLARDGVARVGRVEDVADGQGAGRPQRSAMAPPPASASMQPRCPQRQSGPFGSTEMWPTSPAVPRAPRHSSPSATMPAAMPVPRLR